MSSEAKYNGIQVFSFNRPNIIYTLPPVLPGGNPFLNFVYLRPLESPFDFVNEIFLEKNWNNWFFVCFVKKNFGRKFQKIKKHILED